MRFCVFTKHLEGQDLPGLIDCLTRAGVSGADLCVRPGYPVTPSSAPTALLAAARAFAAGGLGIDMVTTPGDFIDPGAPEVEPLLAACAEAGVTRVKLGYWRPRRGEYRRQADEIRRQLGRFERLGAKHGLTLMVHTHSGDFMGVNAAAARALVEGCDPRHIGIFLDTGHLAIDGEPFPQAVEIAGDYLAAIALKDLASRTVTVNGRRTRQVETLPVGHGLVEWHTVVEAILALPAPVPLSLHCEYVDYPVESVVDQCRVDRRYLEAVAASVSR